MITCPFASIFPFDAKLSLLGPTFSRVPFQVRLCFVRIYQVGQMAVAQSYGSNPAQMSPGIQLTRTIRLSFNFPVLSILNNRIGGGLPTELGNLSRLKYFMADNNAIAGVSSN